MQPWISGDGIESTVEKILEYHEKVPPSNPDDLDLMERVLNKFKVGRMSSIYYDGVYRLSRYQYRPMGPTGTHRYQFFVLGCGPANHSGKTPTRGQHSRGRVS